MYPYFYPSYFSPTKAGATGMNPSSMGNAGMVGAGMGAAQPGMTELPPVLGKTPGSPVEPVTPAPYTMQSSPVTFDQEPGPPVTTDIGFTQAYLKTQIGKRVRVEFLIGTNMITDRIGELVGVGISYILLRLIETDDILLCDIYSIKFVTIYH